jgi:hypothetical protein
MPTIQQYLQKRGQNLQTWSAAREEGFNRSRQQNSQRIDRFQHDRERTWNQLRESGQGRIRMARERGADWENYRRNLWGYRHDRADEIRDRIRDACDDIFTFDWWRRHDRHYFVIGNYSPWWWWNPCAWDTAVLFGGFGWSAPIYYDYGVNVIVDDNVYVDGEYWGPRASYAQRAIELGNPPVAAQPPVPPQAAGQSAEWQPFGVFALTQEDKGDAIMFFQLAMNKDGLISGAFTNVLVDDVETVTGSIDKRTQRAAWHVGDKTNTVFEAGVANLTQDVAPVLIHFDTRATQTWLLVRLPSPDLPTAPTAVDVSPR